MFVTILGMFFYAYIKSEKSEQSKLADDVLEFDDAQPILNDFSDREGENDSTGTGAMFEMSKFDKSKERYKSVERNGRSNGDYNRIDNFEIGDEDDENEEDDGDPDCSSSEQSHENSCENINNSTADEQDTWVAKS